MAKLNPTGKTMGQINKEVQRGVTDRIQKNSVKVVLSSAQKTENVMRKELGMKPGTAKQAPNPPNAAKTMFKNDSSRTRASDAAMRRAEKDEFSPAFRNSDPSYSSKLGEAAGNNATLKRKPNLQISLTRTSGLKGREVGAMDHMGGHGLQGGAISAFGGGGLPEQTR